LTSIQHFSFCRQPVALKHRAKLSAVKVELPQASVASRGRTTLTRRASPEISNSRLAAEEFPNSSSVADISSEFLILSLHIPHPKKKPKMGKSINERGKNSAQPALSIFPSQKESFSEENLPNGKSII